MKAQDKTQWSRWIKNTGVVPEHSGAMVKVKLRCGDVFEAGVTLITWDISKKFERKFERNVAKYKVALDYCWYPNTGSKPSILKDEWWVGIRFVNGNIKESQVKNVAWENIESVMDVKTYRFISKHKQEE
jgi:hypothetical protein